MRVAFVGGEDFDEAQVLVGLRLLDDDDIAVVGDGRGFEREMRDRLEAFGYEIETPEKRPDWYGRSASNMQVIDMCIAAECICVAGKGSRSKLAQAWFKRCEGWRQEPARSLVVL